HAGIEHVDVNGLRRKIGVRRADGQRAVEQIKGRDVVRDVHDGRIRIDLQNDALQRANQVVVDAVVRRQGNDRVGQGALSSAKVVRLALAKRAWRVCGVPLRARNGKSTAPFDANEWRDWRQECRCTVLVQFAYARLGAAA